MDFNFRPYLQRYEALARVADQVFERVAGEHPECVRCGSGCVDCCYALFDLTLIEALYINQKFNERYSGSERERLLERANRADRRIAKIKREAYRELREGRKDETRLLAELGRVREQCPLLDDDNRCILYAHRPITCRFYGIPTAIGGKGHTCGLSGFEQGGRYPTVQLERIHQQLQQITAEMLRDMQSNHVKLVDLLMPLSMALMTVFDEEFFGIEGWQNAASKRRGR